MFLAWHRAALFVVAGWAASCSSEDEPPDLGFVPPTSLRDDLLRDTREQAATKFAFEASGLNADDGVDCVITFANGNLQARRLELINPCAQRAGDVPTGCSESLAVVLDPSIPLASIGIAEPFLVFVQPFAQPTSCAAELAYSSQLRENSVSGTGLTLEGLKEVVAGVEPDVSSMGPEDFWRPEVISPD